MQQRTSEKRRQNQARTKGKFLLYFLTLWGGYIGCRGDSTHLVFPIDGAPTVYDSRFHRGGLIEVDSANADPTEELLHLWF